MRVYKRWLKQFFAFFAAGMVSVALFNYFVDSAGVFGSKSYLPKAADALLSGKMVAGLENFNERLFQSLIIKKNDRKVDAIALGSSRSMMLRGDFAAKKGELFFNHAVSGASLEDYMAMIDLYESSKGYIPKRVIIGVDPWIFNRYSGQYRWRTLKDNYYSMLSRIGAESGGKRSKEESGRKWKQLFNYEYFIANLKQLGKIFKNRTWYIADSIDIEDSVRVSDGSFYYPLSKRDPDLSEVNESAEKYLKKDVYSLEKFDRLDNIAEFEKFVLHLKSKGSEIVFVLFPYHPVTYEGLVRNPEYAIIKDVEKYLIAFAKKNGIELLGSYDPAAYGFGEKDFMDGMHGLERVGRVIFEKKRGGR